MGGLIAKAKIQIDYDKVISKSKLEQGQKQFVSLVRSKSGPYVPFVRGDLKNTAKENKKSITYSPYHRGLKSYAAKNYYTNAGMGRQGLNRGGKRGRMWVPRMWVNEGDSIVNEVAKTIGGKATK